MRINTLLLALTAAFTFVDRGHACPELNRYPANTADGQLSIVGGVSPAGQRAADDFYLPSGNGLAYNVRTIKAVMIANYTLSPSNVGVTIYADYVPPGSPTDAQPGTVAAGPPNSPPQVQDLGPIAALAADGRPMRAFEVSYSIPSGFMQLQAGRWYWLSPIAYGAPASGGASDVTYVAQSAATSLIGQPAYRSSAVPGSGAFTTWTSTALCCSGTHDLSLFVNAIQIGTPWADIDCDRLLSVADIFGFLSEWFAGSPPGDFNGIDGANVSDIFDYLNVWFAGT